MKRYHLLLCIIISSTFQVALAQWHFDNLQTTSRSYSNATISRIDGDNAVVTYSGGITRVPLSELQDSVRQKIVPQLQVQSEATSGSTGLALEIPEKEIAALDKLTFESAADYLAICSSLTSIQHDKANKRAVGKVFKGIVQVVDVADFVYSEKLIEMHYRLEELTGKTTEFEKQVVLTARIPGKAAVFDFRVTGANLIMNTKKLSKGTMISVIAKLYELKSRQDGDAGMARFNPVGSIEVVPQKDELEKP